MLHITNGDVAAKTLAHSGLSGDWLPWRDVLHMGPVPPRLDLFALAEVRARYIAERGWDSLDHAYQQLCQRDQRLQQAFPDEPLVLWFEHDLYDQLQLIQIIDHLARQRLHPPVRLVQSETFLSELSLTEVSDRLAAAALIDSRQFRLAQQVWDAFRRPDPRRFENTIYEDTTSFPYLRAAILRQLEEFPAEDTGLTRTEQQILTCLAEGHHSPSAIFAANQQKEPAKFMGDTVFLSILHGLMHGPQPILKTMNQAPAANTIDPRAKLELTETGYAVLNGDADWQLLSKRSIWIGGCRTSAAEQDWRWRRDERRIVQRHHH
jgi:hypothetical protein